MNKLTLNDFMNYPDLNCIYDPNLILSLVEKMWRLPFKEMFHIRYQHAVPSPFEYIYEEFTVYEHLIPEGEETFYTLSYGNIIQILNKEIEEKISSGEKDSLINILIVFGNLYKHFM